MTAANTDSSLRLASKLYAGALIALAVLVLVWRFVAEGVPGRHDVLLAGALAAAVTIAFLRPLEFEFTVYVNLVNAVVITALLLLPSSLAIFVAATGGAIAWTLLRQMRDEILFNSAQVALETAAGALALALVGWSTTSNEFHWPEPFVATIAAGVAMFAVNTLAVAFMIGLHERVSIFGAWMEMTIHADRSELINQLSQLGIGLLTAIVADTHPWALALLMLPIVATYLSLEQHVDMRHRAEHNLHEAQRLVRLGSWDWDLRTGDQRWSDELFKILGFGPKDDSASSDLYLSVVHPDDRTKVSAALGAAASSGAPFAIDHRIQPADSAGERVIHARGEVVLGKTGRPERVVGTAHDITARKALEQRLQHQAYHDPLTDLPNRQHFLERLDDALKRAGNRTRLAVLFLDLDRFKLINDTHGHEAGDQLLKVVAERLLESTRPGDVVARLGGDEFTILLLNVAGEEDAIRVSRRIIDTINQPIVLNGNREAYVSTSIGIVRPGPEHRAGAEILRDADNALYRAKEQGRNKYVIFDATMRAESNERFMLESDLRHAIARDQLNVLYQPKIDLETGRVVAVEAFVRWQHPTHGWVPPAAFVPIAEEIGMIDELGYWVLREACTQAVSWDRFLSHPPLLNVNLSGKQFHDPQFVTKVEDLLVEIGLAPNRLVFEVRETVAMSNADATIEVLWRLRRLGVRVVIDDFGTGFSNLSFLQQFPVDTLQLDSSFVAHLGSDKAANTMADAVIRLAHGLGLSVVAEGVERTDQLVKLRDLGCEQAQGHLFSRPLTHDALNAFLIKPNLPSFDNPAGEYA